MKFIGLKGVRKRAPAWRELIDFNFIIAVLAWVLYGLKSQRRVNAGASTSSDCHVLNVPGTVGQLNQSPSHSCSGMMLLWSIQQNLAQK